MLKSILIVGYYEDRGRQFKHSIVKLKYQHYLFYNDPVSIKVIYEIRTRYCQIVVLYNQFMIYGFKIWNSEIQSTLNLWKIRQFIFSEGNFEVLFGLISEYSKNQPEQLPFSNRNLMFFLSSGALLSMTNLADIKI